MGKVSKAAKIVAAIFCTTAILTVIGVVLQKYLKKKNRNKDIEATNYPQQNLQHQQNQQQHSYGGQQNGTMPPPPQQSYGYEGGAKPAGNSGYNYGGGQGGNNNY